ncbi:PAS domain-containing protein [Halorubrum sp. SD690R]|uniref:PAS domain-containing protein n=1 Tax=Halorubrum sp. SD690R TaxID=2518117 RepID=UPI001F546647|nr:PAS domain-containing protein [Halorubrum sp. SD690R]
MRSLFNRADLPEAAFVVDDAGDISQLNTVTADLLDLPASKAVGINAYDVFGAEGEDETLAEEVVRTETPIREEEFRSAERQRDTVCESRHPRRPQEPEANSTGGRAD